MSRRPKLHEPFSTVLVATDLTEGGAAALDRALALPLAPDARVDVLHVLSTEVAAKARARLEASAREALGREIERARATARSTARITATIARGEPFVEIVRRARRLEAELVVIGRHGRRPIRDLFIGSTATRVVRSGDVPVLVVRAGGGGPYRRPVVGTDLRDTSARILKLAFRIAGERAVPRIVHAYLVPFEGLQASTRAARDELRRAYGKTARRKLEELLAPYALAARWSATVVAGDARSALVSEVARRRADLLVLGTHGRSGLARVLIGSVAEFVIASAPCDVLVARPARFSFELP